MLLMAVQHVRDLVAWQKGIELVEAIYAASRAWPRDEMYGLTAQIRRAVVSVPSNIAEGQGRFGSNEFVHFLGMAHGSLMEVFTQIAVAQRLRYLRDAESALLLAQVDEVARIIHGLVLSIRNRGPRKK